MSSDNAMVVIGYVLIAPHLPAGWGMGLGIGFWLVAAVCKVAGA